MVVREARPWSWGAIGGALNVLAVLILLGLIASDWLPPAWAVGGYVATVVVLGLAEGAYRTWDRSDAARAVVQRELEEESSSDAVIARLRGFRREFELLREEIPDPDAPPTAPRTRKPIDVWIADVNDVNQRVTNEVRLHAAEMLKYWRTNPKNFDPLPIAVEKCEAFIDYSLEQLGEIERHLRDRA